MGDGLRKTWNLRNAVDEVVALLDLSLSIRNIQKKIRVI
jgi:hypothetical protein